MLHKFSIWHWIRTTVLHNLESDVLDWNRLKFVELWSGRNLGNIQKGKKLFPAYNNNHSWDVCVYCYFNKVLSRTSLEICILDVYQSMKSVSKAISFIMKWINDENCLRFQASLFLELLAMTINLLKVYFHGKQISKGFETFNENCFF